ncbi:MAG: hypothetical protein WC428_06890 [Candidatus Paceibacterota bacterium]
MLQPISIENEKLLCPRCKTEVEEYPPDDTKQAKFECRHCKSSVVFKKRNNLYLSWITDEF